MDKNPFLKQLMKDEKADVVHSSAYAKTQNTDGIGAASVESFATRQALEAKRTMVKNYKDSMIAVKANLDKTGVRKFNFNNDAAERAAIKEKYGGKRLNGVKRNDKSEREARTEKGTIPPSVRINPGISR